jgi:hypothetical protein
MRRALIFVLLAACNRTVYVDPRAPCAQHDPLKNVYWGDLHVHTANSFDVTAFDVRNTPADAYRFARGEPLTLPPLDANGQGTRTVQIDRPLDFAAVTDHAEFLGEVETCTTPGAAGYDAPGCVMLRAGGNNGIVEMAIALTAINPSRDPDICGADGSGCADAASAVWASVKQAAADAYDTTAACSFTSFVAYEYTAATNFSTLHRNVIFANEHVPQPTTYFEQPTPQGLWRELQHSCLDDSNGCDVLAIPHNPNESNGNMFFVESSETADDARQRVAMEPLVEVYQHKAASECFNGLSGILGAPDEQCSFEAPRRDPVMDCGDGVGSGGVKRTGCFSRLDFARGILLAGLSEEQRIGVNPYRLGFVSSTDTHNGTPGLTTERGWAGHRGLDDDTSAKRLGSGTLIGGGIEYSPGGLVAVWAEENSRPAIFSALRRREVYGTSGPRIPVRFFAGYNLPSGICTDPQLVATATAVGVPMGGLLSPSSTAPTFVVSALRDPSSTVALQRIQIIKGWVDSDGWHQSVTDIAGGDNGASVDATTCAPTGSGSDTLCGTFTDPDFHADQHAFYYARVLENPTCRWSAWECLSLPVASQPAACTDPTVPTTIQERAWTSPIWYSP